MPPEQNSVNDLGQIRLVTEGRFDSGFQGLDTLLQPVDKVAEVFDKISPLLEVASALTAGFKFAMQLITGPLLFFMGLIADGTSFITAAIAQIQQKLDELLSLTNFDMARAQYVGNLSDLPTALTTYFTPYNSQTVSDPEIHANPSQVDMTAVVVITTDKATSFALSPDNFCIPILTPQNAPDTEAVPNTQATFVSPPATSATLFVAYSLVQYPGAAKEMETPPSPAAERQVAPGQALRVHGLPPPQNALVGATRSHYVYLGLSKATMRRAGTVSGSNTEITIVALPPSSAPLPVGASGSEPASANTIIEPSLTAEGKLGATWLSALTDSQAYTLALFRKLAAARGTAPSAAIASSAITVAASAGTTLVPNQTYQFSYTHITGDVETAPAPWTAFTTTTPGASIKVEIANLGTDRTAVYVRRPALPDTMFLVGVLTAPPEGVTDPVTYVFWAPTANWFINEPALPSDPAWEWVTQDTVQQDGDVHTHAFTAPGVPAGEYRAVIASSDAQTLTNPLQYSGAKFFASRARDEVAVDFVTASQVDVTFKTAWDADAATVPRIVLTLSTSSGAQVCSSTLLLGTPDVFRTDEGVITTALELPDGTQLTAATEYALTFQYFEQETRQVDSVTVGTWQYAPAFFASRADAALAANFTGPTAVTLQFKVAAEWASSSGVQLRFKVTPGTNPSAAPQIFTYPWAGGTTEPDGTVTASQQLTLAANTAFTFTTGSTYEFVITPVSGGEDLTDLQLEAAKSYGQAAALVASITPLEAQVPFLRVFYILKPVKEILTRATGVLTRAASIVQATVGKAALRKASLEEIVAAFDKTLDDIRKTVTAIQETVTRILSFRVSFKAALRLGPVHVLKYDGKASQMGETLRTGLEGSPSLVNLDPATKVTAYIYIAKGSARSFVSSLLGG